MSREDFKGLQDLSGSFNIPLNGVTVGFSDESYKTL